MEEQHPEGGARGEAADVRRPAGPPWANQAIVAGSVATLVVALLAFFGVAGALIDEPFKTFTKEAAEQAGLASYAGALAEITWFLWVVAGSAGALAVAALARRDRHDDRIPFFVGTTALTALLLLDDFAMLHDEWLPLVGVPEEAVYVVYAVILVALLARFRGGFASGGVLLALAAGGCWTVSLGVDFLCERWEIQAHLVEDGAKIMGTALWAAFMVWGHLRSVRAVSDPAPAHRRPRA